MAGIRVSVLVAIAAALLSAGVARAGGTETTLASARVVKVDAKARRVTVDRGSRGVLTVGETGNIYPLLGFDDVEPYEIDFALPIAHAKVVSVSADQAVVALDKVVHLPTVGAVFAYRHAFPVDRMKSPLFRLLARGVVLLPADDKPPFLTFESLLADPTLDDKTIDIMLADTNRRADAPYTRDELLTGLAYLEFRDNDHVSRPMVLSNALWASRERAAADAGALRREALVAPEVEAAEAATKAGKLDDARTHWRTVLASVPTYEAATTALAHIDTIQLMQRGLASDPDNIAGRFALMSELMAAGAYGLALAQVAPLRKGGFEAARLDRQQAVALSFVERYAECAPIFAKLAKTQPDEAINARFCAANARLAKTPGDAAALIEIAAVREERQEWDLARRYYRFASYAERATPKQRETATHGRARAHARATIAVIVQNGEEYVRNHAVAAARNNVDLALTLAQKLADPQAAYDFLAVIGGTAYDVEERELAAELFAKWVEVMPARQEAYTNLAWTLARLERIADAEVAAKRALALKVRSAEGDASAHATLAYVAHARNDMTSLEKEAIGAAKSTRDPGLSDALLVCVEAARGDWQAAVERGRKAFAAEDIFYTRNALTAANRGLQAHEALQANPSSPRERLRLVRAFADLALVPQMAAEIAKLPADGSWREDGWFALVDSNYGRIQFKDRLAAARNIKPTLPYRKSVVAALEARAALEAKPSDETKHLALARVYLTEERWHRVLAMVLPLGPSSKVGIALETDARNGLRADSDQQQANAAFARGDYEGCIKLALAAQATYDRLGGTSRIPVRQTRAVALMRLGRFAEASSVVNEALALIRPLGNPLWSAVIAVRAAEIHSATGTTDALRAALADSVQTLEGADNEVQLYELHRQSADLASTDGQWAAALDHARKSWTYADRAGQPASARSARLQAMQTNLNAGRIGDAEQVGLALLADARKASDWRSEVGTLYLLAEVARARGQGKLARTRTQEIYAIAARYGDTAARAEARRTIGLAWLNADHDPRQAILAFEQAVTLFASLGDAGNFSRGHTLRSLASARLELGDIAGARKAAEESAALSKRVQWRLAQAATEWLFARIAIAEKKGPEAIAHAKAMLEVAQKTDDDEFLAGAWHSLARGYALTNKDQEALGAYEKFITYTMRLIAIVGSDADREGYLNAGDTRRMMKDAIEHMLKLGKTARAMEVLDLTRDSQLRQAFDPTKVQAGDAKARAKLEAYDKKRARVQGLEKQLEAAQAKTGVQRSEAQVKAIGEQIVKTRKELSELALDLKVSYRHLYQALALTPDALADRRAELPAGSVVVEYFVTDDALYAFVVSAALTQPAAIKVAVSSANLTKAVHQHHDALLAENEKIKQRDKVDALGRQLAGWLIEPLRTHLKDATTVIVLPFGVLNHVPFDALVMSAAGQPVRYAIEDFRISVQSKTTLEFLLKPASKARSGTMLAISNPDGSLPGAQREVQRILKSVPDARVLGKKDATVAKFKSTVGGFRYIHLATHGIVESDPRKSFLKLSDGQLTIKDIAQLQGIDQTNELVVLSACETAMEKDEVASDEQITLAVAFAMAGAPAIVASLWEVGDDSTGELMATFYRALAAGNGDRLEALRNAKLNLLRMKQGSAMPFAAPWHWAGFQLLGDFRAPL